MLLLRTTLVFLHIFFIIHYDWSFPKDTGAFKLFIYVRVYRKIQLKSLKDTVGYQNNKSQSSDLPISSWTNRPEKAKIIVLALLSIIHEVTLMKSMKTAIKRNKWLISLPHRKWAQTKKNTGMVFMADSSHYFRRICTSISNCKTSYPLYIS